MNQKMAKMNGNIWYRCQGSQIELLAQRLRQITRSGRHKSREIFDFLNRTAWQQKLKQRIQIDPAIGCFTKCPVIEIESIYIDVCSQNTLQKCRSHPKVASRPATEATGEICAQVYITSFPSHGAGKSIGPIPVKHLVGPEHHNHFVAANVGNVMRPAGHGFHDLGLGSAG